MAVLVRHTAAGMRSQDYDLAAPPLTAAVKKQPGFIMHLAHVGPDGMVVDEVWESQDQHDTWFEENVVPNVPAEIHVEVIQLHNLVQP
jgi:hypothetical protein